MTAVNKRLPTICLQIGPFRKVLSLPLEPNKPHEKTLRDAVENILMNPQSNIHQYIRNCDYTFQKYNAVFEEYVDLLSSDIITDGAKLKLVKNDVAENPTASAELTNYHQDRGDLRKTNRAGFRSEVPGDSDKYVPFERKPAGPSENHMKASISRVSNYYNGNSSVSYDQRSGLANYIDDGKSPLYGQIPGPAKYIDDDKSAFYDQRPGTRNYIAGGKSAFYDQCPGPANYIDDGKSAFYDQRPGSANYIDGGKSAFCEELSSGGSNKQPQNINLKTLLQFLESPTTSETPLSAKEADVWKSTPIEPRGNPGFLRSRDTEQIKTNGSNGDRRKSHKRREQSTDFNSSPPFTSDFSGDKELEKRRSSSPSSRKNNRWRDPNNKSIDHERSDERASSKRSRFSKRDDGENLRRLAQLESQRNSVWKDDSDPFLKEPAPQQASVNKYFNWVRAGASVDETAASTSEETPVKPRKLDWKEQLIWEGKKLGFNENEALSTRAIYDGGLLLKSKNPVQMLYHFLELRNKARPEFVECWDGADGYYQFYVCIGKQQCITSDRHSFDLHQAKVYAALKALHTLGRTKQQVKQTLDRLKQE